MKLYGVISPSTETRTRIAVAQTGKKYTAETLIKISEKKRQDTPYGSVRWIV